MSRNRDRVGAQPDANPPAANMNQDSSGGTPFSFVVPTEFVELPSGGRFYPEGHPLHKQDSLEIRHMTAKEEDMLTSRTLLKKGVALDRVIKSIIVDKRIDPDSLLVGDRNAIIIATRISGYGADYETKVTCPACGTSQNYGFNLNESYIHTGEDDEVTDITNNNDGTFSVVLPRTGVNVTFKLMNGHDERRLLNGVTTDNKKKTAGKAVTRQLTNMIVAVEDDESPQAIRYLVDNIPSLDARHLRLSYRRVAPNIDLTQDFVCQECDHEQEMEVPLSAEFFWPDR